jgi:uncharacterized protein (DUF305 family)
MRTRTRQAVAGLTVAGVLGLGVALGAALQGDGRAAASVAAPGPVDIGFSQDMIVHHEQAVLMAQLVRGRTADPTVAALAAGIEDDQLLEIGTMRGWLALWGAPTLPAGAPMTWMTGSTQRMTTMPGMATAAELNSLRTAQGTALDLMFLQLMLRHHNGGLPMLTDAGARAGLPVVRGLAQRMAFTQREETRTILGLLNSVRPRS